MIDVDLLSRNKRFPNLAQMKMSAWCKEQGHNVRLIYDSSELPHLREYDVVLASKVFTDTEIPEEIIKIINDTTPDVPDFNSKLTLLNSMSVSDIVTHYVDKIKERPAYTIIQIGGTGFFPDGGRNLDPEIENIMPDYDLYNEFVKTHREKSSRKSYFNDFEDCSIGFLTRGCFRKCSFCVNKKYDKSEIVCPDARRFYKEGTSKIYLWDDNFLAIGEEKCLELLDNLKSLNVPFQFRQGLDIRLMTEKIAKKLMECKYYSEFIFAFDHIEDEEIIVKKLNLWKKYCGKKGCKLYVLCGYDARSRDSDCEISELDSIERERERERDLIDIENTFKRILILMKFGFLPYVTLYESYKQSKYRRVYINLRRWCNQPQFFKKTSFEEYCTLQQKDMKGNRICSALGSLNLLKEDAPQIYEKYCKCKYECGGNEEGR